MGSRRNRVKEAKKEKEGGKRKGKEDIKMSPDVDFNQDILLI